MIQTRSQSGFTLIEVMVSILLASLLVVGAVALFRVETRASGYSRRGTEAIVLAEDKLEQLRTVAQPAAAGTGNDGGTINENGRVVSGAMFTRSWVITAATDGTGVYDIVVTVSWNDGEVTRSVVVRGRR